jgi:hypothetical protein
MEAVPATARPRLRTPWALVPVALLLSSALGVGSMAMVAARDPHFATEPDYYQKAVRWDQTQAQAAVNQRLGYVVAVPPVVRFDRRGQATLDVKLSDRLGQPLTGAQLAGGAFANAYSGKVLDLVFEEPSPGLYRTELMVNHSGQWVVKIAGTVGGEHFTHDVRLDLLPGGPA